MRKLIPMDYVPEKSKLVFIKQISKRDPKNKKYSTGLYRCECGVQKEIMIASVKFGLTISCGCYNLKMTTQRCTKHGYYYHPAYRVWAKVKTRCYDVKAKEYPNYGGRGVIMCDEWKDNPKAFVEWCINNGHRKGLDIDKDIIASKIGLEPLLYSPERCMFVTRKENLNNKRNNVYIEYNGKRQNLSQWALEIGIHRDCLSSRIQELGWSVDRAFTTPIGTSRSKNYKKRKIKCIASL